MFDIQIMEQNMQKRDIFLLLLTVCVVVHAEISRINYAGFSRINQLETRQKELEEDLTSAIKNFEAEDDHLRNLLIDEYETLMSQTRQRIDVITEEINLNREKIKHVKDLSRIERVITAEVTAYTATEGECDEDPWNTAAMLKPQLGMIAVSRDLFYEGWVFGKKVYIEKMGIFVVGDLMNQRWEQRIDVLMPTKELANQFGKKTLKVALLDL